jgi:hypothetical protein
MEWGNMASTITAENRYNRILEGSEEDRKVMHVRQMES